MTCQELVHAIDPYLDDELSVLEVLRVHGHLLFCDPCRTVLESESQLHALLAADAVQDQPALALRQRILEHVSAAGPAPGPIRRARNWIRGPRTPVAGVVIAGLLVSVLLVTARLWSPAPPPPFAAEIVAKHRLYREAPGLELVTTDVSRVARWLEAKLGVAIKAPAALRPGDSLVGGRVSSIVDVPAAYLQYQWGGHRLSLFILRAPPHGIVGGAQRMVDGIELYTATGDGIHVAWWEDGADVYAAAATSVGGLEEFARLCVQSGRSAAGSHDRIRPAGADSGPRVAIRSP
jgi:anti-sigma factor RsiW